MKRLDRIHELEQAIGSRELIWLGIRGSDAQSLLSFHSFSQCHSLTSPLDAISLRTESCLERIRGRRMDLDQYLLHEDQSTEASRYIEGIFSCVRSPAVVVPYRPASLFSAIRYVHRGMVEYLGLFEETQAQFEHKPWVESELRLQGVATLPWTYHHGDDLSEVARELSNGPRVLRLSRSAGGTGFLIARTPEDLEGWPRSRPGDYFAEAPFLHPTIPLNVGGVVFPGGDVSLHGPSLQLIGIPSCTNRPLGYCGNDFAAIRTLPVAVIENLEDMVYRVGRWMGRGGYQGAFGVDAVVHRGEVYLAEVNPRFQGSSSMSARLDEAMDRPDIFLDHMAAFLGLECPPTVSLTTIVKLQPPLAHCVIHNTSLETMRPMVGKVPWAESECEILHLPSDGVSVEPGGMLCRAVFREPVTVDGFSLSELALRSVVAARDRTRPLKGSGAG